jgi:hypothetical protein
LGAIVGTGDGVAVVPGCKVAVGEGRGVGVLPGARVSVGDGAGVVPGGDELEAGVGVRAGCEPDAVAVGSGVGATGVAVAGVAVGGVVGMVRGVGEPPPPLQPANAATTSHARARGWGRRQLSIKRRAQVRMWL